MSKADMTKIDMAVVDEIHAVYKHMIDQIAANVDSAAMLTLAYMIEKHGVAIAKVTKKQSKD